jgi:hypothetical protein
VVIEGGVRPDPGTDCVTVIAFGVPVPLVEVVVRLPIGGGAIVVVVGMVVVTIVVVTVVGTRPAELPPMQSPHPPPLGADVATGAGCCTVMVPDPETLLPVLSVTVTESASLPTSEALP